MIGTDFIFGKKRAVVSTGQNTFIGNVANIWNSATVLATAFNWAPSNISDFEIVGNDIKFRINSPSELYQGYGMATIAQATYFINTENISFLGNSSFAQISSTTLKRVVILSAFTSQDSGFYQCNARLFYIPNMVWFNNYIFGQTRTDKHICVPGWFPSNQILGATAVHYGATPSLLQAPSAITDLAAGNITSISSELTFTPPFIPATNPLEKHDIYINDVYNSVLKSGRLLGLNKQTNYPNIKVKVVDFFGQESELSNQVNLTTTDTLINLQKLARIFTFNEPTPNIIYDSRGISSAVLQNTGVTANQPGIQENCFGFTGAGEMFLSNMPDLTYSAIGCWFKTPDAGSSYRGIFSNLSNIMILTLNNVVGFYYGGFLSSGINIADNQWHLVIVNVVSGGTSEVILDGVLRASIVRTVTNSANNLIGRNATSQRYSGLIDTFYFFNAPVTVAEAQTMYNNGAGTPI